MKLKRLNSNRLCEVNVNKYLVDWDKKVGSGFQFDVKQWLRKYWNRQICLEEFRIPGSLMRVDLINLNKRVAIEISGQQHVEFNKHFHKGSRSNFLNAITRDAHKRTWLEQNSFKLAEIYLEDLPLSLSFFREKYDIEVL